MTVQDLIDWCEEHDQSPEYTDIEVYANSSIGWTDAVFASQPWAVYLIQRYIWTIVEFLKM